MRAPGVTASQITAPVLTEAQRETLARALADAVEYRRPGEGSCKGCENYPDAALCDGPRVRCVTAPSPGELASRLATADTEIEVPQ